MKKFSSVIAIFSVAAAAFGAPIKEYGPDPVLSAETKAAINKNIPSAAVATAQKPRKVLVFGRTTNFRHYDGIVGAKYLIAEMGKKTGAWETVATDDISYFEADKLKDFDCVVMANTTGAPFSELPVKLEKMTPQEREAVKIRNERMRENLINYVKNGGGLFGIHAATDTFRLPEDRYEPYLEMIGADFVGHPWYSTSDAVTCYWEEPQNAVAKGIWPRGGAWVKDEIYMFGKFFDRSKVNVIMSLDVDRSPDRKSKMALREDKDCALVWIKDYGKGRVAYGAFGHSVKPYLEHPEICELYMRLLQFACGDLKADTASHAKPNPIPTIKLFDKPTKEYVKSFENADYGLQDAQRLDAAVFAFYNYNDVAPFRLEMGDFLADELASNKGTPRYRALLAQLANAVFAENAAICAKFVKVCAAEKDDTVRSRLQNVIDHFKNKISFAAEGAKLTLPAALPQDKTQALRVIRYVMTHPQTPVPAYLKLDEIRDADLKTAMIYALGYRKEGLEELRAVTPQNGEEAIALAYAFSRMGDGSDIVRAVKYAKLLNKDQTPRMAVNVLAIPAKDKLQVLSDSMKTDDKAQALLVAEIFGRLDIAALAQSLLKDFDAANDSQKFAIAKILDTLASPETFIAMVQRLPAQKDQQVRNVVYKILVRSATDGVTPEMFAALKSVYDNPGASDADKRFLLRFAPAASTAQALALCESAYKAGYTAEVVRYLSQWNGKAAFAALIKIAENSVDAKQKAVARAAIVTLINKAGPDAAAYAYVFKDASDSEKTELVKLAVEKPDSDVAKFLEANGQAEAAKAIIQKIKSSRPVLTSSHNGAKSATQAAFDGNLKSRWATGKPIEKGMWIMFDLGYPKGVSEILLDSASSKSDRPATANVYAGDDPEKLTELKGAYSADGAKAFVRFPAGFAARYVKIISTDASGSWWSIHEAEIK